MIRKIYLTRKIYRVVRLYSGVVDTTTPGPSLESAENYFDAQVEEFKKKKGIHLYLEAREGRAGWDTIRRWHA